MVVNDKLTSCKSSAMHLTTELNMKRRWTVQKKRSNRRPGYASPLGHWPLAVKRHPEPLSRSAFVFIVSKSRRDGRAGQPAGATWGNQSQIERGMGKKSTGDTARAEVSQGASRDDDDDVCFSLMGRRGFLMN